MIKKNDGEKPNDPNLNSLAGDRNFPT